MRGIAASPGIAIGKVYLLDKEEIKIDSTPIENDQVVIEIRRFNQAQEESKQQIETIKKNVVSTMSEKEGEIFAAHLMVVSDPTLVHKVEECITNDKLNAEAALVKSINEICQVFESMEEEYLRERATDIKDVGTKILFNLAGVDMVSLAQLDRKVIVVSKDLTPSDTAQMDADKILGFITDEGGRTSHAAIMARTMEIPAVVGSREVTSIVKDGEIAIVDGSEGLVIINPTEEQIEYYSNVKEKFLQDKKYLKEMKQLPAITIDGKKIELAANIGVPKDVKGALENGAEGIGLFRTEFLYMNRSSLPTEEEQFEAYKVVGLRMAHRPIIIRTLDIGGDKNLEYMKFPKEMNPFLGWRAIRMCLDKPEILKTQLKAILRASHFGKFRIMYPMIINIDEIRKANQILTEAKNELEKQRILFDRDIQTGIMVETPAAALIADILINEVDFFSIGTNDLTQYTLAVDRGNEMIANLYQPMHLSVLRLIKRVVDASHRVGKWTGMCGELAGDEKAAILLLGMGLDELSMSAGSIPRIKKVLRGMSYNKAKKLYETTLQMASAEEIILHIENSIK